MIQRIQTLWLLLAAACGFAMTKVPMFAANLSNNLLRELIATESLLLFALVIGLSCLALVCIFLFKKRPLQFRLAVTGIILSLGTIALEVYTINDFKASNAMISGTYQWGALFPILMAFFFFLAARGIRKDQKLVKSLDRLR